MDSFLNDLSNILQEVYYNVLKLEEYAIKSTGAIQLSISEMHLIEVVGKGGSHGVSIRKLADQLRIKSPSVSVAVNKLCQKGCITKTNCEQDGRVVRVSLTQEGRRIDVLHKLYHRKMVHRISEGLSDGDKNVLLKAIQKLNEFFAESYKGTLEEL